MLESATDFNRIFFTGVTARIFDFIQRSSGNCSPDIARSDATAILLMEVVSLKPINETTPSLDFKESDHKVIRVEVFNFVDVIKDLATFKTAADINTIVNAASGHVVTNSIAVVSTALSLQPTIYAEEWVAYIAFL